MKVNPMNRPNGQIGKANPNQGIPQGSTYISPNIVKVSERFDRDGNIINPRTKQIIEKKNE